jgi:iron complex transport system ATP-binding protein
LAVLEVRELSVNGILKGISFRASRGEVVGIVGRNGAGKSSLLKAVGGFYPYGGSVKVEGVEVRGAPVEERVRLANYLPQSFTPPPGYGAREFLEVSTGRERKEVEEALREFGLEELSEREAAVLSGGERVKLLLARLKLISPKVYLLDEPSAYLDLSVLSLLEEFVREVSKKGVVLVVSHDVQFLWRVANRFLGIKEGRELFFGERGELLENLEELFECSLEVKEIDGEILIRRR